MLFLLTFFQNAQKAACVLSGDLFETCLLLVHGVEHIVEYHLRWMETLTTHHSSLELICSQCPLRLIASNQHKTVKTMVRGLVIEKFIYFLKSYIADGFYVDTLKFESTVDFLFRLMGK